MIFPLVSLILFLLLHVAAGAIFRSKSLAVILVLSGASFLITLSAVQSPLIYALASHAFLLMLYLHFYVGVDRSVSIRVLNELLLSPTGSLSMTELDSKYPNEEMFAHRIRLMIQKGWLVENGGKLGLAPKAWILVQPTTLFRKVYGLKSTW